MSNLETVLILVLLVAATYRLARFVAIDTFPPMKWLRTRIAYKREVIYDQETERMVRLVERPFLGGLITCPHCVGFWIAGLLVVIVNVGRDLELPVLWWLATAGLASFLASIATWADAEAD